MAGVIWVDAKNVTALWPAKKKNVASQDLDVFSNSIYFKRKYQILLLMEQLNIYILFNLKLNIYIISCISFDHIN